MLHGLACLLLLQPPPGDEPKQDRNPPTRLTVPPAAEPVPALRNQLLPEMRERSPGNAALLYYRAFSPEWNAHRRPEVAKLLDAWSQDTDKPPHKDLRWVKGSKALEEIDLAARREYCEWELAARVRKDGIQLLLPDVQSFREYIRLLAIRARFEMLDGEHDKVVHTMQTGLSLARDVANAPTLIHSLVGMALAGVMLNEVEQWVQKPGSPNLYWSLTHLPTPFIDLRKPLQGERLMIDNLFPEARDLLAGPRGKVASPASLQKMVENFTAVMRDFRTKDDWTDRVDLAVMAARIYPEARRALADRGYTDEQLDDMPLLQVVVLYEILSYDIIYDDYLKWLSLPYRQSHEALARLSKKHEEERSRSVGKLMAKLLMPATQKVVEAGVRVDRRIAALRCVEAVRLYAAEHGKLPARLADVGVPVPIDPVTGQGFSYEADGNTFTLTGVPFPGRRLAERPDAVHYKVTVKEN